MIDKIFLTFSGMEEFMMKKQFIYFGRVFEVWKFNKALELPLG